MEYDYAGIDKKKAVSDSPPSGREEKSGVKKEAKPLPSPEDRELYERMKEEEARLRAQFMFGWYY